MNKQRRAALTALQGRITALQEIACKLASERTDISDELESLKFEEQDGFDNLSEGLQQAERGVAMEDAVSAMEDALSSLSSLDVDYENDLDEAFARIEDAKSQA